MSLRGCHCRRALISVLYLAIPAAALPTIAQAQEATVTAGSTTGGAGETVEIPVTFTPGSTAVSSLRFELILPAALAYVSTAAGSAATNAGKSATGAAISDGVRVLVFGLNNTPLGQGAIALVTLRIAAGTSGGTLAVEARVVDASSPDATMVQVGATSGSVTVPASGPSCGNSIVESGETCDPVSSCPTSCDDGNSCTVDNLNGSAANCSASCSHSPISQCTSGDGCCPAGCNANTDSDCSASCGNGVLESGETCDPVSSCPTSCDDGNSCTVDNLNGSAANCSASCSHSPISQCTSGDGCCPAGCNANTDSDCSASCGNGVLESGETCDPVSSCPTSCDDGNSCTVDNLNGSAANCSASCSHSPISQCTSGDGCCPAGCNANTDSDCSASCGNGVLESGETCDPVSSCPTSCDDGNSCTVDNLNGSAANCSASCSHSPISQCTSGDGCCPAGCNANTDSDCSASCGNSVLESGETCDPVSSCPTSCDDGDSCTVDNLTGSPENCSAACSFAPISECATGDGCCPAGCDASSDADCGPTQTCTDQDSDGFGDPTDGCQAGLVDCDDGNSAVFPGADERCNGVDDDCDGAIDEDFDLQSDAQNCGACGNSCAGRACQQGTCAEEPSGSGLVLSTPQPGEAGGVSTITVSGATPNGVIELAYGRSEGSTSVRHCNGLNYQIDAPWYLRSYRRADANGNASFRVWVHRRAAGLQLYLQAADRTACSLSNVIQHTFAASTKVRDSSTWPASVSGEDDAPLLQLLDDEGTKSVSGGCSVSSAKGQPVAPLGLWLIMAGFALRKRLRRRSKQRRWGQPAAGRRPLWSVLQRMRERGPSSN